MKKDNNINFDVKLYLNNLYQPPRFSHKGQNGKLLIIGGSHLFHAASLWALKIASRICDMVFYSSVPENNEIVAKCKEEFRDGIVVRRDDIDHYIREADCILIGPGMNRRQVQSSKFKVQNDPEIISTKLNGAGNSKLKKNSVNQCNPFRENPLAIRENPSLREINKLQDEGELTYCLTQYITEHYPNKKFVLDAGSLQELDLKWLEDLKELPILTPHHQEIEIIAKNNNLTVDDFLRRDKPPGLSAIVLLKGPTDIIYSPNHQPIEIPGGVPGMTKGGTGDVLAGLLAAFYCKSEALTSAVCASFFNKKAGEDLFKTMGNNFNASDLVEQLPITMKKVIDSSVETH